MTNDLSNLLKHMQIKRSQCAQLEQERNSARDQYKQADSAYDQAVMQYAELQAVLDYCLLHDCDETYARMMLSDPSVLKQHVKSTDQFLGNSISGMIYQKQKSIAASELPKSRSWFDKLLRRV